MFTLAFLDPYGVCFIYSKGEKKYLGERLSDGQQVCSGTKCENRTGKFQSYVLPPHHHRALVHHTWEALPSSMLCSCLIRLSCGRLRLCVVCSSCRRCSM